MALIKKTTEPVYTVYKMTVIKTRQFYIGLTVNYSLRQDKHKGYIFSMCRRLKTIYKERGSLPCYKIIAQVLVKGKRFSQIDKKLLQGVGFCQLAKAPNKEEGKKLETIFLMKYKDNPLCLNIQNKSHYNAKSKKVV